MTSERLFNSFIPPKNFYTPPKKQISGYAPDMLARVVMRRAQRNHASRYIGCQSASASASVRPTKSPLRVRRSRLVGCHRRRTWIHCRTTTSRHGLADFQFQHAASDIVPRTRTELANSAFSMEQLAGRRRWRKQFTVVQKTLKTYL